MLIKMLERAIEYVPNLRDLKAIRSWTGFRAATPDGMPYIGPHPRHKTSGWRRAMKAWASPLLWRPQT